MDAGIVILQRLFSHDLWMALRIKPLLSVLFPKPRITELACLRRVVSHRIKAAHGCPLAAMLSLLEWLVAGGCGYATTWVLPLRSTH